MFLIMCCFADCEGSLVKIHMDAQQPHAYFHISMHVKTKAKVSILEVNSQNTPCIVHYTKGLRKINLRGQIYCGSWFLCMIIYIEHHGRKQTAQERRKQIPMGIPEGGKEIKGREKKEEEEQKEDEEERDRIQYSYGHISKPSIKSHFLTLLIVLLECEPISMLIG